MVGWIPALLLGLAYALNNGAANLPPMGWSSWDTFNFTISTSLIQAAATVIVNSGLREAGYTYVLIDDGWTACLVFNSDGSCQEPAPRNPQGQIVVDPKKFPGGFQPLTEFIHNLGLKAGIYTAVSRRTCGGYTGSLYHERIDAESFVAWGFDFVKQDTCNQDCAVRDGCIQASTARMAAALNATGRPVVIYIDDGNDSTDERLFNPYGRHVAVNPPYKMALRWPELVWHWGPERANMWKSWFDRADNWESLMDNLRRQASLAIYQESGALSDHSQGAYNTPDMLTVGEGGMSPLEETTQMAIYAVLGCPLVLGCNVLDMSSATLSIDPDCVQGSLLRTDGACETWGKPLHDGTFAVVMFNKGEVLTDCTLFIGAHTWCCSCNSGNCNGGDFYPAKFSEAELISVWNGVSLGQFAHNFTTSLAPHASLLLQVLPTETTTTGSTFEYE